MKRVGRPSIKVEEHDSVPTLRKAYQKSRCAVERRRIQAIWFLRKGKSRAEVSELTGCNNAQLVLVIKRYNEAGLEGLKDQRHKNPGRTPLLSDAEILQLAQCVRKDYEQGIYWQGKKVVKWIDEELGKEVHEQRAYEYLKTIGMSRQRPRPHHAKADPVEQERFKKNAT